MKLLVDRLGSPDDPSEDGRLKSKSTAETSVATPRLSVLALIWIGCLGLASFGVWGYQQGQTDRAYFVDEGVYTFVGWSWLHGEWPYRDVWDHKGPTVYATAMLRTALGGTEARVLGTQEIAIGIAMAMLLAGIAFSLWGSLGPPIALALGTLVWAQRPVVDFGPGSADPAHIHMSTPGSLIALFSTAAILCALIAVRKTRPSGAASLATLSGICAGLAACTKLNALAGFVVALAILALPPQPTPLGRRVTLLAFCLLGAIVPFGAFGLLFRAGGSFNDFVDAYFRFNSIRGGLGLAPAEWLRLPLQIVRNLNYAGAATLTFVVLAASMVGAVQRWIANDDRGLFTTVQEIVVPAWLMLELLGWLSNGGAYAFRVYPVLPEAALGGTWLVLAAARSPSFGKGWALIAFLLLAVPSALTLDPLQARVRPVPNEWLKVARDLATTTEATDTVLSLNTWRATSIMSLAKRPTASRYVTPVPLFTRRYASDARWAEILETVQGPSAPRVVLVGTPQPPPPADGTPTVEKVLVSLNRPDLRAPLIDHTLFPSLARLKSAVAARYRVDYCLEEVCVLRRLD